MRLKKPPSSHAPSNSSFHTSNTSSWLQIPLPTGGTALKPKNGQSLLHHAVGNSTSSPCGVVWQYGRALSMKFEWETKPCCLSRLMECFDGSADGTREPSGRTSRIFLKTSSVFNSSCSSSSTPPCRKNGFSCR